MQKKIFIFFLLTLSSQGSLHAKALGLQIYMPTIHLSKETYANGERYSYKLNSSGQMIWMPGVKIFYDQSSDLYPLQMKRMRLLASFHQDCMNRSSYIFHLGPRWELKLSSKSTLMLGLGPTYWMRKTWEVFDFYSPDPRMKKSSVFPDYEYRWFLFADIDFLWDYTDNFQIILSIVPALPFVFASTIGILYAL